MKGTCLNSLGSLALEFIRALLNPVDAYGVSSSSAPVNSICGFLNSMPPFGWFSFLKIWSRMPIVRTGWSRGSMLSIILSARSRISDRFHTKFSKFWDFYF